MQLVRAEIELTNADDIAVADRGFMPKHEIRSLKTEALVDTGAYMLAINQRIRDQLGLRFVENLSTELADGSLHNYEVVGTVMLRFENRITLCKAIVLPGDVEVLFGAIPMEDMDLVLDPKLQKLMVHPERPFKGQTMLKGFRPY
jgi:clan AA aspartic protease